MLLSELNEAAVDEFTSFEDWSKATKKAGGDKHIKTPDKQRIYAVARADKPVKHAYGMWDEKFKKGTLFAFKQKLKQGFDYDV